MVNKILLGVITTISGLWSAINLVKFAYGGLDLSIPTQIVIIAYAFLFFMTGAFTVILFSLLYDGVDWL